MVEVTGRFAEAMKVRQMRDNERRNKALRKAFGGERRTDHIEPSSILKIQIREPVRNRETYHFSVSVSWDDGAEEYEFGFHDPAGNIQHHPIWDSLYPLIELTASRGPVFGRTSGLVQFFFEYPVSDIVATSFETRGRQFGFELEVIAERSAMSFQSLSSGDIILMGGGKDSRMLLGTLREIGLSPKTVSANSKSLLKGIENVRTIETIGNRLTSRIMPALMELPGRIFHGSGLGEAHWCQPWHRYYYFGSPLALNELNELLASLGAHTEFRAPQSVLPYNITQKILADRYPDLYEGQYSVKIGAETEKNLHISLIKALHEIDYRSHCSDRLFTQLLRRFTKTNLLFPERAFGERDNREIIVREMRSCARSLYERGLLSNVKFHIPNHWHEPWIDKVHTYVDPNLSPDLLGIYTEYADEFDVKKDVSQLPVSLASLVAVSQKQACAAVC
jgi:hypothetical protein